jgi:hypothetical protein
MLAAMRLRHAIALALALAACSEPERSPTPRGATTVFSPAAAPAPSTSEPDVGGARTTLTPDPAALDEILAAAPRASAKPTGPDGGTLVGVATGAEGDAPPDASTPVADAGPAPEGAKKKARVNVGDLEVQLGLTSASTERAARAQLYYPLTMRCRDRDGKILPPDAITLRFNIDADGYIVPSSISASAADPRHEDAANCMRRELGAATFRAPRSERGESTHVNATIPSVD